MKKYQKENLTIQWEPDKCIHAGVCVKQLPGVYNPKARPWIKPENASVEELKKQIELCPSGALSYQLAEQEESTEKQITQIEVLKGGPLLVRGELRIKKTDGSVESKSKQAAFCRCGHSSKPPYCDGSHRNSGFQD